MAKRSDAAKSNKSNKSRSPKEGHAQSSGRGARPDKAGGRLKKSHEKKSSARNDEAFGDIEKMTKGNKSKNGCLPKLFMLFLPFVVVGAYFFLST